MDFILLILILIVLIIFGIIMMIIVNNFSEKNTIKHYSKLPFESIYTGDAKNMKMCPQGCVRGVCSNKKQCLNSKNENCCVYDFQCNYCKDGLTKQYYLDSATNPQLDIKYQTQSSMDQKTMDDFEKEINQQNDYIDELNKEIKKINKQNGY